MWYAFYVTPVGPREQILAALDHVSEAIGAIDRANDCVISKRDDAKAWRRQLATARTDLQVLSRQMRDALEELTPLRPSAPVDMREAFATASTYPGKPDQ